jgi:hypothetical protein
MLDAACGTILRAVQYSVRYKTPCTKAHIHQANSAFIVITYKLKPSNA